MNNWQPIETAPKDGMPFAVYMPSEDVDDMFDIAYWDEDAGDFVKVLCGYQYCTHWMPLEPPE